MLAKLEENENPIPQKELKNVSKKVDIRSIKEETDDDIAKTPLMMRISNKMKA